MTPQQKADYEFESIMRASLKPIARHSQHESKPKILVSFQTGATITMPNTVMKWERSA